MNIIPKFQSNLNHHKHKNLADSHFLRKEKGSQLFYAKFSTLLDDPIEHLLGEFTQPEPVQPW